MGAAGDLRVLLSLARGQPRTGSLQQRLEAFYGPQAERYDAFRERMLHGRQELLELMALAPGQLLIELGAGTARNAAFLGERLATLRRYEAVDLCPALLEQARRRCADWPRARVVEADVTHYRPSEPPERVFFSYSLSMIPQWREALDNAISMLAPGGLLGAVDFYISRPRPRPGHRRHGAVTRALWPRWFRRDGVSLEPERLEALEDGLKPVYLAERRGPLPFLPGLRVPYFVFVGRKPQASSA